MSLLRYSNYKDSGVEWLGDVPEHWEVLPCRAIVHERTAKNEGAACIDYLSLMANIGVIPYAEKGDVGNKKPEDVSKCKIVTRGDFVINSMNYGIGSYGLSDYDGVCSSVYIVLKPQNDVVESRFAFRIFENRSFQTYAQSFGNGILEHRCAINWDILKPIGVGIPPMVEQKAILAFLDRETAKIDGLVAEQRRLMELLKEKRQAVISHAVTKGLNPDAPMKPSGIEWLGDVPAHWEVKRYKNVLRIFQGMAFKSSDYVDYSTTLSVRMGNIKKGGSIDLEHNTKYLPDGFSETFKEYTLKENDLIIAMTDMSPSLEFLAVPAIMKDLDPGQTYLLNQRVGKLVVSENFNSEFIKYLLLSDGLRDQLKFLGLGTVQSNMSSEDLYCAFFVAPSLSEQTQIAAFLDAESGKLDTLTAEAQRAIDLLQERRTALISAAVTGKIDVREQQV